MNTPQDSLVDAAPDQGRTVSVDAVAGGWVLGTILTKQDVHHWGTTTNTRQIVGYQYASSKAEAVGQFVAMTQERNPGYSLGEIVSLKLPPAVGQAPNDAGQPRAELAPSKSKPH